MYELSLLKSLLKPENYSQYRNYITKDTFPKEVLGILYAFDAWYKAETTAPTVEDISNIVHARGVPEKDSGYVNEVLKGMNDLGGDLTVPALLERVKHKALCQQLTVAAMRAFDGTLPVQEVISLAEQLKAPAVTKVEYVTEDLEEILQETVQKKGLRWRLDSLNKSLGSLRKGDFGFLFARPETGKTTFLASETTYMASQLAEGDGPILWFNNEEQGKKVKLRQYQAALGARLDQLLREPKRAKEAYAKATKTKLRLIEAGGMTKYTIESILQQESPSLVVFDQIDKLSGFKADRPDLELGEIYQWAREMAKRYCPVIGVSQADATAEGERWLHMGHVAGAKTSKQAEADFIIGIGKTHDAGYDYVRFINISKNKLTGDDDTNPSMRHAKIAVQIKPDIARVEDIE